MTRFSMALIVIMMMMCQVNAQIDMVDSTVQSIAYWQLGEEQKYVVSESEIDVVAADTMAQAAIMYDVSIKVVDSTSFGYIIEWTRDNYRMKSDASLDGALIKILAGYPLLIMTDEYGGNPSVLNWEDVSAYVMSQCETMAATYGAAPPVQKALNTTRRQYATKEMIDQTVIRDVQQMLVFHGARYKLGETVSHQHKVPNNYGGDPLDATTALVLDELIPHNDTYIIKTFQNINPQQLKAVTYDYLSHLDIADGELPAYEDFPTVLKQVYGGAEIHGSSGWVIYSQETEQVTHGETVTTKERLIEMAH